MEETINLKEIVKILKKRILLIISILVIGTGTAVGINYFLLPEIYQAQTQILVNQNNKGEAGNPWSINESDIQLIDTYNVIIKSPAILSKVIEELDLKLSSEALSNQITVSNEENSKVVNIIVEDTSAKQAVEIANKTAVVFKEEVPNLMNVDNINILSNAKLSDDIKPVKPNKILNVVASAVGSLLIGIGLTFLIEVLDTTIKDENDIEAISEIPIIGVISPFDVEKSMKDKQLQ